MLILASLKRTPLSPLPPGEHPPASLPTMKNLAFTFLLLLCCANVAAAQNTRGYRVDNFDMSAGVRIASVPTTDAMPARKSAKAKLTAAAKAAPAKLRLAEREAVRIKPVIYTPTKSTGTNALAGFTTGDPRVDAYIVESGGRNGVDPALLYAIMHQESSFKARAVSYKGAAGLMQMMPGTAARFGVRDRFDPQQSVEGGARYMRFLLNFFDGDYRLALAGYNAGEGAVLKYGRRVPPYRETQDYVRRISARYEIMRDPAARRFAPVRTLAQIAEAEADEVSEKLAPKIARKAVTPVAPPPPSYERDAFAVKLPDGKLRLVSQ